VSVADAKRRMRRELGRRRREVDAAQRAQAGARVARHLLLWAGLCPGRRVALYAALPDEVPTHDLMDELLRAGHPVLLPRAADAARLEFAPVTAPSALVVGAFGALEPKRDVPAVPLAPEDLVLLPGVAFDPHGRRLGRGGGWYDRSLPRGLRDLFGIAYEFQLVDRVPATEADRNVRGVFTERGLRCCERAVDLREPFADPG
jgi:5-formyltetrahydrofolate cyclo-ligase